MSAEPLKALVVHPQRVERVRLIRPLRAHFGRNVDVSEAANAEEALARLDDGPMDIVLVAEHLPPMEGLDLAAQVAQANPGTAIILVADHWSADLAARVARSAACDYVVRGHVEPDALVRTISGAIRQARLQADYRGMVRRMRETHEELDHFVRALSHDMNANFLVLEHSFSRLERSLRSEECRKGEVEDLVAHVRACLCESKRFLNDLVGLARTGRVEMEPEPTETLEVVDEVLFEQKAEIDRCGVRVEVRRPLPRLWCNRHRLKQVVTNLVRNALKHGTKADCPRLIIDAPLDETGDDALAALRIADNGPGIPTRWREEIFRPGRRLPDSGTEGSGMGLAIVRKIVAHYGGKVHVESSPEGGAAFVVQLPSVGPAESVDDRPDGEQAESGRLPRKRLGHDQPHDDPPRHRHRGFVRRAERH